ncbi:SRPBCC domain-containing protein [Microbacterium sp. CFBP9034]|uniref:SRPBCC domain-containing protein n=1 Tax=Microbacterium sp. CFBP9034 TaxID=3096540 RepID=UPI002A6B0B24|nr:SRPBCC domain-containing protein [Microbacterium sp. CFBP9034]MDY0907869.1 SRPBCC domain-containing protein [Microbacterium sp. CFBP9034]
MRVDAASRFIAAEPEVVFRAFTDPALMLLWLPPEGMSGRFERFDSATGYRLVLRYDEPPVEGGKASSDEDIADVRRTEVDPPERVVEEVDFPSDDPAFAGTMTMTWTFTEGDGGTHVDVAATGVPAGIDAGDHAMGMASSLRNLARLVE